MFHEIRVAVPDVWVYHTVEDVHLTFVPAMAENKGGLHDGPVVAMVGIACQP